MTFTPHVCLGCGVAGGISGAVAGAQSSELLAIVGGIAGVFIGFASFVAFTVPYVYWIYWHESRHRSEKNPEPPLLWRLLFLPVMISSLLTGAIVPFFIFRSN